VSLATQDYCLLTVFTISTPPVWFSPWAQIDSLESLDKQVKMRVVYLMAYGVGWNAADALVCIYTWWFLLFTTEKFLFLSSVIVTITTVQARQEDWVILQLVEAKFVYMQCQLSTAWSMCPFVIASPSFSIWAYHCSVSVIERDAYATGLHFDSVSCVSTTPRQ